MRRAVIDVGSNSVLLVVADQSEAGWNPVLETSEVTGLGRGTKATGLLSDEGMADTLAAVARAFERARNSGAISVAAWATMAARIASNTGDFERAALLQGTPISVLSGEEEAGLGYQAVVGDPKFRDRDRLSIIDVGGHSTEVVTSTLIAGRREVAWSASVPIGTLGLRSGELASPSPSSSDLVRAAAEIDEALSRAGATATSGMAVALGASATNLVSLREAMMKWDPDLVHGAYLDYEEVGRAVGSLSELTDTERALLPGLEPGREGTIHIGALILERCLFALQVEGCFAGVRGWRHAMLEEDRWFEPIAQT